MSLDPGGRGLSWYAPPDGGTPRAPGCLQRLGPREWRITASVEEGHSPLTHAVSRIDLVCRNDGDAPQEVTVHLDLGGAGGRSNFDDSPFGGMPRRDFAYVQHVQHVQHVQQTGPAQSRWRRVDGTTDGWVASLSFSAPPGETRFGLSPWYTYGDYRAFVASLPAHPCLRRRPVPTPTATP